jgi:hypothetical protein
LAHGGKERHPCPVPLKIMMGDPARSSAEGEAWAREERGGH